MDVSIVIVNYNTCRMTNDCIDSIFDNTNGLDFEVILIDNHSTDGSKEFFENDSRVKYLYSFENMGFGRANNVGIMLSKGDYILLLNNDTLLLNNAVKLFHNFAIKQKSHSFIGSWLLDEEHHYIHSCANFPTIKSILSNALDNFRLPSYRKGFTEDIAFCSDESTSVGYITGADLFFHRSIYELTGGFDHKFFMYYEEADWQLIAKKNGIGAFCINGPKIVHFVGGSQNLKTRVWNVKRFSIHLQSMFYYVKKHYSKCQYLYFRLLFTFLEMPLLLFGRSLKHNDRLKSIFVLLNPYN